MRSYVLTLLAASSLLAACGSSDSINSADTDAVTTAGETTVAETTTEAPTTLPAATVPQTTIAPTTTVPEPRTFDPTKILHEGYFYTAGNVAIGTEIRFTATDKSRYSNNLPGLFSVQGQASGDETLLSLTDVSTAFVFKNPLDDYNAYGSDKSRLLAATDPLPADYLAYVQSLPGVTAGPITDSQFAGFAARSMSYQVGDFAGFACNGTKLCLLTIFQPTGMTNYYNPGDSGTLYMFDVGGHGVLADVQNRDGASEFVANLTIG